MKRFASMMLFIMLAGILAACGGTTAVAPTTAPVAPATTAPQPTTAPVAPATTAPQPTTAAATTAPEATTAATTTGTGAMMDVTGELTIWHAYGTGSSEETAVGEIVKNAQAKFPKATINVLQIPFDQVFTKFETEAAAGGGPDMWIAPNDNLGTQVRAGLLLDVTELTKGMLDNTLPLAIEGCTVDGKLYCVPESLKAVALYYNKAKVASPPKTTEELLKLVQGGNTLALNQNAYHNFGFWGAFGGKLFDAKGTFTSDKGGFTEAMTYLQTLKKESNVQFYTDGGAADTAFREGTADMIINGPWALGDYRTDLKDNLAVAPMPAGPGGPASPLTGVDGFYINKNTKNAAGAVALAVYMVSPEAEQIYVDVAGHVPADKRVKVSDALVQGFAASAATGYPRPQFAQLNNYWGPFGDAINAVLEEGTDPAQAIIDATTKANDASKTP